ncbi:M56 family metallopeptidase [Nonomuraea diastatica]|uniref:M56 family peptidase n=1 Tax=Nonomuraea diastatica TaxID=1848329 RepID=A0A4R4X385_9ACTN|nr:M56 family metallopeptidase [Nonomuraea diastatica]TDD24720.1 M56 family peptidase [Nonomuraea diastatica]
MTYAAHHLITLALALAAAMAMPRAPWSSRCPRAGVLVWQAIALTAVSSLIGALLAIGLAPLRLGIVPGLAHLAGGDPPVRLTTGHMLAIVLGLALTGWLLIAFVLTCRSLATLRRRQRALLSLIAATGPDAAGAHVVEHPAVAAYCVPGRQAAIVVSTGALGLLPRTELAAVLAHEWAHARERHDLALLPFAVLERALPWSGAVRAMLRHVAMLVEMRADDRAARAHGRATLSAALRRFHSSNRLPSPAGTLGSTGEIDARLRRLSAPEPPPRLLTGAAMLLTVLTVATTPLSLFLLPL